MFMTEWFMCLFTRNLPWASVLRVWDAFLCEGTVLCEKAHLCFLLYLGTGLCEIPHLCFLCKGTILCEIPHLCFFHQALQPVDGQAVFYAMAVYFVLGTIDDFLFVCCFFYNLEYDFVFW